MFSEIFHCNVCNISGSLNGTLTNARNHTGTRLHRQFLERGHRVDCPQLRLAAFIRYLSRGSACFSDIESVDVREMLGLDDLPNRRQLVDMLVDASYRTTSSLHDLLTGRCHAPGSCIISAQNRKPERSRLIIDFLYFLETQ